jgi:hypothetical protein
MSRRFAAAVLILLAGLALPAHAQTALKWNLKKGDRFYVRNVTTATQKLAAANTKPVSQKSEQTVVLGFSVEDQTDQGLVLKETIEQVTIKPEKGDPVSDDKVVGAFFLMTISPKWEILKFDGYDKFINKVAGDDTAVRQALLGTLPEETFKKSVREVLAFLPDNPVKQGEVWEQTIDSPLGALGTLRETRKYKYEGKDADGEKITFTTAVTFAAGKRFENLNYYVLAGRMDAKDSKGTIHFNSADGRLVRIVSELKLTGSMKLSISDVQVGAELEQEQTSRVEISKENPVKK